MVEVHLKILLILFMNIKINIIYYGFFILSNHWNFF